jgi:hypothetical protein
MKIQYVDKLRLNQDNKEKLITINKIITEYAEQGYRLTLRQLYYQLVSKDIIPNKQSEYAKLSTLLTKGRMAGFVDWDAIEDRLRKPYIEYSVRDVSHAIKDTIEQYKLNRQLGQETYIEVWVEKDALSGVLRRITDKYHVKLMVNRGYSSTSAMHDSFIRMKRETNMGKEILILYLGDYDPSGLDMIRDIKERLNTFGLENVDVSHIGITKEQIDVYNPPPNPAKITDPRADWYIEKHGAVSWEVDALPPKVLNELLTKHIEESIDMSVYRDMLRLENHQKEELQELMEIYNDKKDGE